MLYLQGESVQIFFFDFLEDVSSLGVPDSTKGRNTDKFQPSVSKQECIIVEDH